MKTSGIRTGCFGGEPRRTRTYNPLIKSQLLGGAQRCSADHTPHQDAQRLPYLVVILRYHPLPAGADCTQHYTTIPATRTYR
jgi:hypothetical protein